jgi:hypothetical protein
LTAFEIGLRFLIINANPKNEIKKKICTYPTIEKTVFFHKIRVKMTAKNGTKRLDAATEGGVKRGGPTITDKHMTRD